VGYQLYTTSSYQQVWGETADSAITDSYYLAAHTTESRSYTVYARIQPDRSMGTGQYAGMSSVRLMY
jgi:spore coat protein U-like protein